MRHTDELKELIKAELESLVETADEYIGSEEDSLSELPEGEDEQMDYHEGNLSAARELIESLQELAIDSPIHSTDIGLVGEYYTELANKVGHNKDRIFDYLEIATDVSNYGEFDEGCQLFNADELSEHLENLAEERLEILKYELGLDHNHTLIKYFDKKKYSDEMSEDYNAIYVRGFAPIFFLMTK